MSKQRIIRFYRATDEYGFLSNFSKHSFQLDGKEWKSVEHYYQSQKFAGQPQEELIRQASTPGKAKKLGNQAGQMRKDWSRVKEQIMYKGLKAKFSQRGDLKVRLISTGDAVLAEHSEKDSYWGDGGNGSGLNRLGVLLQQLRDELSREATSEAVQASVLASPSTSEHAPETNGEVDDENEYSESDDGDEDDLEANTNQDTTPLENTNSSVVGGPTTATPAASSNLILKPKKKGQTRNKMRKNIWKDQSGGSLFAKDNQIPGQVSLVNQGISVPISVLTPEAKYVVYQNQFRRKWNKDEDEDDQLEDIDRDEDEYEHNRPAKTTLGDFLGDNVVRDEPPSELPEYLTSPLSCLAIVAQNLSLLESLSPEEATYSEVKQNLSQLKQVMIQFVDQQQDEQTLMSLFAQIEALNQLSL